MNKHARQRDPVIMEHFTPVQAAVGGLLIGTAATLMLWTGGIIAGISGILARSLFQKGQEAFWGGLFLCGLLLGGATYQRFNGRLEIEAEAVPLMIILAGLLVGFGTRMGNGCPVATASAALPDSPDDPWWPRSLS